MVDDIAVDSGIESDITSERDIRVDHDNFNLVGDSRITYGHLKPSASVATPLPGDVVGQVIAKGVTALRR